MWTMWRNFTSRRSLVNLSKFTRAGGSLLSEPIEQHSCQDVAPSKLSISGTGISRFYGTLTPLAPLRLQGASPLAAVPLADTGISLGGLYIQTRGLKYKGKVKRRCRDCYLIWINGLLYNLCKTHPRHKQCQQPPIFKNQQILTHATMSPKRQW